MKVAKILIVFMLFVMLSVVLVMAIKTQNKEVPYTTVEKRTIRKELKISGKVEPYKEIDVKSSISGVLEELYVNVGDTVNIGDPIARVQFVKDPIETKQLMAQIENAKKRFETKGKQHDRQLVLYKQGYISKQEYEQVESDYKISQNEYEQLQSEMKMLKGEYTQKGISNVIVATGKGTILELPIKEGGSVMARGTLNEGTSVAKIADLQSLVFNGNVLESDVLSLYVDMPIKVSVSTNIDSVFNGKIRLISPKAITQDGIPRFSIMADIEMGANVLNIVRAGCTAIATIVLCEKEEVCSINEKYIEIRNDSSFVKLLDNEDREYYQYVQLGISDGIYSEVVFGLDSLSKIKL